MTSLPPSPNVSRAETSASQTPRDAALAAMSGMRAAATGLVNFDTAGRVLVIGRDERALAFARRLAIPLAPTLVLVDSADDSLGRSRRDVGLLVVTTTRGDFALDGHMGDFHARLRADGDSSRFDLVVDMLDQPLFADPWSRFGYHATGPDIADADALAAALEDEVGEFQKPRYFAYDASLCVRGRSGFIACNRCVQACPAGAITGLAEAVEVDPFLCQGGGICATVCPGGAMQYAYPRAGDAIERLRRLLEAFRAAGGRDPEVLVHDTETALELAALDPRVLPYAVEEVAGVGMEFWLSALAFGARALHLLPSQRSTHEVQAALDVQLADTDSLLTGLGYPAAVVGWWGIGSDASGRATMTPIEPAAYAGAGSKREILFLALDHLAAQAVERPDEVELAATAPLGEILVDADKCTLCVSCATLCPRGAITADEDRPALLFFEVRCVQCGLCEQACPEHAIRLHPRLLIDRQARGRRRLLHEEPAFECIRCGKPFATRSAIEKILSRLDGHRMFAKETARSRLKMCADCRVIDMTTDDEAV